MKANDNKIIRQRKRKLNKRLRRKQKTKTKPVMTAQNIHYEMADRTRAISSGGIGAFHTLAKNSGLVDAINNNLHLLKIRKPYSESDHVLNIAYNILTGGTCLEDIELHRNDEAFLDALGADTIPDPTTAGDFSRRFSANDVTILMDAINSIRSKFWQKRMSKSERRQAIIDVDGTTAPTSGECKQGMDISYKGIWSYHPLIVSLANTAEPLFLVNRSGNRPSHDGAAEWMDKAAALARQSFASVCFRGDTDFYLTENFDRWSAYNINFAFGMDAMPNLVEIAENIETGLWRPLKRRVKRIAHTKPRRHPENVKEKIVVEREFRNIKLQSEHVAEFSYRPTKCKRDYRVVVLRKNLSVEKGERCMFPEIRYFFYITNIENKLAAEVVFFCNDRCNQENLIEQLKNGLNAMRMPVGDLVSNWAYMVMSSLAWTLKGWFGLMVRNKARRAEVLKMEFRRFLHTLVQVPCQIVRTGRRIVYRVLSYNDWLRTFFGTFARIRRLRFT